MFYVGVLGGRAAGHSLDDIGKTSWVADRAVLAMHKVTVSGGVSADLWVKRNTWFIAIHCRKIPSNTTVVTSL